MKRAILIILAAAAVLSAVSCAEPKATGNGAGRVTADPVAAAPGEDTAETSLSSSDAGTESEPAPDVPTGKVSRPADLSAVNSIPRDFFPDANKNDIKYNDAGQIIGGGSWWMGKTEYDPATGEVTTKYERSAETLALLDKYGAIYLKNPDQKVCYFTFDCGYEYGLTGKLLDVLKEKNAPGTFFITGAYIDSDPKDHTGALIKRMYDEGHIVGTHTNNHKNMALVSAEEFIDEILSNEAKLKALFPDAPDMVYYRPPEGASSEWALAMAKAMGLTTVFWSWTQYDYNVDAQPDPAVALENAKRGLRPGCVYLFHVQSTSNAAILGDLIDFIRAQGFEIRRIDK